MRAAIVIPTIREENIIQFLDVWKNEFAGHLVIVVEDNPEPSFNISGPNIRHYSWKDIDKELGEDAWIIPRRTDCIRSYGYLKAYHENVEIVVTLDDDCYPHSEGFLRNHFEKLTSPAVFPAWVSTGGGIKPRGMPYFNTHREVECVLNHGLWTNIPDFDAIMQLANTRVDQKFEPQDQVIPLGCYFPMCGMNVAFKPKIIPAFYFLLMGQKNWPFDRYGDIWCGIFIKKICDHLGLGVKSGEPLVDHKRASNVWTNLKKELPGYEVNEVLWKEIDAVILTRDSFKECYLELSEKLPMKGDYWDRLRQAMRIWAGLF